MESEFSRIDLECVGEYVIPRNPAGVSKYPEALGPNQACTLFGSTPGSDVINGSAYVSAAFDLNTADIWRRNLLVIIGWFIFFQITQVIAIECFQVRYLVIS